VRNIILVTACLLCSWVALAQTVRVDTTHIDRLLKQSLVLLDTDPDSAYILAGEGYRLSQQAGYQKGIARAFMRFASVMKLHGKNDSAKVYFLSALHIRKTLNDDKGAAGTCIELSEVYQYLGKRDSAFYFLFQALRLHNVSGDSAEIASTYIYLGNLYTAYKEPVKSLQSFQIALKIFGQLNDTLNIIRTFTGFGYHFYELHEYKEALSYFLKAVYLSQVTGNESFLAGAMNNVALCYDIAGEYKKAKPFYFSALRYYKENDLKTDAAMSYYNIGNLYANTMNPDSALVFYRQSLALANELHQPERAVVCLQRIAEAYAGKGNYLKAYEYHLQSTSLSDSLLNTEKVKQIAEMQTRYETETKEQEIVLLSEQNKTKAAQRNVFIAGTIVLLLAVFVLGIIYLNRQKLALKNEQIAQQQINELLKGQELKTYNAMIEGQEEERKRIATDLHDRLGSMLSTVKLLFSSLDIKIDKAQENNQQQFDKAGSLLDEAVMEVRRISHNLSTGMVMSFGLVPALQELCSSIDNSRLIQCRLLAYGMNERLDQQTEIELYRMVQEVFSNILKHAKAKQVTVQLNRVADSLNITIEDDGIGFDITEKRRSGGLGLKNIEARAARLNGTYHIDSKPGRGTISIIEIPITQHTV
jgi:two-component system NarL family sensor kinase